MIMRNNHYTGLEIAVIGLSCRLPGANNIDQFWDNLKNGRESIHFFSDLELIDNGLEEEIINNKIINVFF